MKVLESMFRQSCEKLKKDECLTDHIRKVYWNVKIYSEQLQILLNELAPLMRRCHDIDSYFQNYFHLQFSKKIVLENTDSQNSALLESEVLNQLLYYLPEDEKQSAEFSKEKDISEKEPYALQYLAGYVFHKLSKKTQNDRRKYEYMQNYSILLGAKVFHDEEQILVNEKDRGGLWKVNNDVQNILSITETMFRRATNNFVFKINEVNLISEAVQSTKLRSYYDNLCQNAEGLVDEETIVNLLEQIV